MTSKRPAGYVETITAEDANSLPVLVAAGEIALVSELPANEGGAKTMILLRSGEKLAVGSDYQAIVDRLALSVGTEKGE